MEPTALAQALKEEATRLGFDLAGVCPAVTPPSLEHFHRWLADGFAGRMEYLGDRVDAYEHPRYVLDGVRSVLMLAVRYRTVEPGAPGPGQGNVSRYAWGRDYHELIRERLHALADFHRRLTPEAEVRGVVDTAPLLEREFGRLAGLGWIGKNTLLLNKRLGSWFFLAALLTTADLAYDEPTTVDHCGTCRACLDACPTGALIEARRLDARRCLSYLTIELKGPIPGALRGEQPPWVFGCDACQEVCPWNRRAPTTDEPAFEPLPDRNPVDLVTLLSLDEAEFRRRFRHTPLARPKRGGVLRNAAISLGNRPTASAIPALIHSLNDAEPVVRGASAWALGRYAESAARTALENRLAIEADPEVRREIQDSLM
jgi:epoxyqueuosine reductase